MGEFGMLLEGSYCKKMIIIYITKKILLTFRIPSINNLNCMAENL
jgi:hypothetical protein